MYRPLEDERSYPLFFFRPSNQWKLSALITLIIIAASVAFYIWCTSVSDDMGGDSFVGLVFAIGSTTFMLLAAVRFSLRRRARKRVVGELNAVLNWHVFFGLIALVMVFLHAGNNFNPRTGTYALYGMVALVISGIVGRALDRVMPRLIAIEAGKALTAQGEDRIESISQKLQAIVAHNTQEVRGFGASSNRGGSKMKQGGSKGAGGTAIQTSWDLAFITLDETPQELERDDIQYRFVPDRQSELVRPGALLPGARAQMSELKNVQRALRREEFYRYVIRYWRVFHICLAIGTVGVTLWHIEYALLLIIPALQKYGFGYLLPWP